MSSSVGISSAARVAPGSARAAGVGRRGVAGSLNKLDELAGSTGTPPIQEPGTSTYIIPLAALLRRPGWRFREGPLTRGVWVGRTGAPRPPGRRTAAPP